MDETIRPIAIVASLGMAAFMGWIASQAGGGVLVAGISGCVGGTVVWMSWLRGSEPPNSDTRDD